MPCYACGLTVNGDDELEVATSGTFGAGDLAGYGGDDTVGAPIYCDSNGQLRTVPEHTSETFEGRDDDGPVAVADGAAVTGASASLTVNNPSAVRSANVLALVSVIEQLNFDNEDPNYAPAVAVTRNAVPLFTITGTFTYPAGGTGATAFFWHVSDSIVDAVAAGGSVTYVSTASVDYAAGTSGSFSSATAIRAMAVTQ